MEQEAEVANYDPAVLELGGESCASVAIEPDRREKFARFTVWLVLFQILAAAFALLGRSVIPGAIGFGQFSIAIDLRYLVSAMNGACIALILLVPLIFAWTTRSTSWRFITCIPLLILVCFVSVVYLFFSILMIAMPRMPTLGIVLSILIFGSFAFLLSFGATVVPLAMRAYAGWRVSQSNVPQKISRKECWNEWGILAGIVLIVFFGPSLVNPGPAAVAAILGFGGTGLLLGVITAAAAFWLLHESQQVFRFAVAFYIFLLVLVPLVGLFLADYIYFPGLPAGSGFWFVGFASGATALLLHAIFLRGAGYRLRKGTFERVTKPVQKTVVDPFSD